MNFHKIIGVVKDFINIAYQFNKKLKHKPTPTQEEVTQLISELTKTNQLLQKEISERLIVEAEM